MPLWDLSYNGIKLEEKLMPDKVVTPITLDEPILGFGRLRNQNVTIKAPTNDISKGWILDAERAWPQDVVQVFCVQDAEWQKIRLSMKGVSTARKLEILKDWFELKFVITNDVRANDRVRCQVDNYLGALRRGGQLTCQNRDEPLAENLIRKG